MDIDEMRRRYREKNGQQDDNPHPNYSNEINNVQDEHEDIDEEYVDEEEEREDSYSCYKPNLNILILGHDTHGKTTLATALGDRFGKEHYDYKSINCAQAVEKYGITINTSNIECSSDYRDYTFIDHPTNLDHLKDLISGWSQIDGAIIVVAATDGPMFQTREYIYLAHQVGVPRLVVFLNNCDLVADEEILELVEIEIRELLSKYEFDGDCTPIIRGSALGALNSEPQWESKIDECMEACDEWIPESLMAVDKPFLMPIEDVFYISGRGSVATGCIETGIIKLGDSVDIVGMGDEKLKSVVTGIEMSRNLYDESYAGDNVGLLLRGIDQNEIRRGMVITHPGKANVKSQFKAIVYFLPQGKNEARRWFSNNYRPQFNFRTTFVTGEITFLEGMDMVGQGDYAVIDVSLISGIALEKGLQFTIVESGKTIGFGQITHVK